ncbi:MAG: DNA polymerase III subunit beta [Pirellulaceae bacterium]|jgi:DNA polymerase-3 subunit beta|nr:DNA polymerase III subunit beta [Pirellulaceae bacterium]
MKITCNREKLLAAFQTAATVAPSRSPKPILQNVKLEVGERVVLMATDMEIGIRIEVDGIDVEVGGAAVLPVDRFGPILRESSDETLRIEADAQGTLVRGERSEFKLPAGDPAEFPAVVEFTEKSFHEAPVRLVKELIRRTLFATDTESSRYALGGVLLEMDGESITAVGTDGRRLAKMTGPAQSIEGHGTGETMTIVPTRSMQLIERALSDGDAEIQIAARTNDVLVRSPRATIYSRLVEGRFPKWREVFPDRQGSVKFDVTVGPVYSAVRQAAIVASDESRGIDFRFGEGALVLSGQTAEVGSSRVEIPIPYDGEPVVVTLDHRFVLDFLRVLSPEGNFTIDVEDSDSATLLTTDDGYGYVVMPLARDR